MDLVTLVAFSSWLAPALGGYSSHEAFIRITYYESLRIGGLVFAVVLFFLGIAIIFLSKCPRWNGQIKY
uniref:FXYD domain-containing ion transport regulator n=1 Tax=Neolamprologus brichardi TaxID=32507 RepID=A0A3Q4N093_NEOBR